MFNCSLSFTLSEQLPQLLLYIQRKGNFLIVSLSFIFFFNLEELQPSVPSYQVYKITFKLLLFEGGIIYNHFLSSSVTLNNKQNMQNVKNNARKR